MPQRPSVSMQNHMAPVVGDPSPWGTIDHVYALGPDVVAVATPSHGGLWVPPEAMTSIPAPLRASAYSGDGWFEEDCDWCIPYLVLGLHHFEDSAERGEQVLEAARTTLRRFHAELAGLIPDSADAAPA